MRRAREKEGGRGRTKERAPAQASSSLFPRSFFSIALLTRCSALSPFQRVLKKAHSASAKRREPTARSLPLSRLYALEALETV